ncbi:hypothetical protein [Aquimarina sp. SS2-1]|uniref:hypothetical protein n=1 Tax=Aquimarina besae TaxID=3342247 RepID=UPI00366CEC79
MTEREHTEYFLFFSDLADPEKLISIEHDPPDFEIMINNKNVSIEHSRLYRTNGEKIKKIEQFKQKILNETQKIYNSKYNSLIDVNLKFADEIKIKGNELDTYCSKLADFLHDNSPSEFNNSSPLYIEENLPKFLRRISIIKYSNGYSFWQFSKGYVVSDFQPEKLTEKIISKSNKVKQYSKNYNENWLLLVIERAKYSDYSNYDFENYICPEQNNFHKIYIQVLRHRPELFKIK